MSKPKVRWRLHAEEWEPTARERGANVYRELRRQGWDADRWNGEESADIIILQWDMQQLDAALAAGRFVVADINDMVFSDTSAGHAAILNGLQRVPAVVAGSPVLAEFLQRLHPRVRMIEQPVGPQYWMVRLREHEGLNLFWMGMHDNLCYFREVDPMLEELAQRIDFTLHVCTSRESGIDHGDGFGRSNVERVAAKKYPTMFHEWDIQGATEVMATCDIGIAPLYQTAWAWCKCANKAVNMMAAGLPVVVSDVPSYRAVIEDGVTGRLCWSPDDWQTALRVLLTDPAARRRMGEAGKRKAAEFAVDRLAREWASAFREWFPPRPPPPRR